MTLEWLAVLIEQIDDPFGRLVLVFREQAGLVLGGVTPLPRLR